MATQSTLNGKLVKMGLAKDGGFDTILGVAGLMY